jgi:DNA-binding response OmpR family regulator
MQDRTVTVYWSSSREERDLVQSYARGVTSYLVKPVDFAQFAAAVRTLGLYWVLMNALPAAGP